jgi:uncharacterized protein (DUF2336 family)
LQPKLQGLPVRFVQPETDYIMLQKSTRFSRLVDLAKETSSDKRRELLREVSDVFLEASPDLSDDERSHFGDIIGKVSANMDVAVRRRLAEQFAGQPKAPLGLIQQLARDEISVAASVLQKSTVLRDVDLIAIAQTRDQQKLGAISARPAVSETVSESIVEHGDDSVVAGLVSNGGAQFSRGTFLRVVERSETSQVLQAPLADRADLPADMLNDMYAFVSSDLRHKLQQRLASIPPEMLEKALKDATRDVMTEMHHVKAVDRKAMVFVAEMARQKKLSEALLVQLARSSQLAELIHSFARLAEVDVKTVRRLMNARNIEGVAIICKSMRFERATFSALAMFLEQGAGQDCKTVHQILDLYEKVTTETAQRVMRFWRVRKEAAEPTSAGA